MLTINEPPRALDRLADMSRRVKQAHHLLLFLDFDGTLAPIVDRPARATLPSAARTLLNHLAKRDDVTIVIMSGRCLADVQRRSGVEGVIYAGNHGLEISGQNVSFEHPGAFGLRDLMQAVAERITRQTAAIPGVAVESKGLTTSVHFRRAAPSAAGRLADLLRTLVPDDDRRLEVKPGKKVYEIGPRVAWDKGRAALYVRDRLAHRRALAIAVGDDQTDEDMFTALSDAITIRVDPDGPTAAAYQFADPNEVREYLGWLLSVRDRAAP